MRARIIINNLLIACCFVSCQSKTGNNNIVLTDFTKELISLYINDAINIDAKNRKYPIMLIAVEDTSYYYLSVFANNRKDYHYCGEVFTGQTLYLGHSVKVFGDKNPMFYSVNGEIKKQKRCKDNYTIYDPNVWHICFFKDGSFNKMRTYKTTQNEDISDIQELGEKYFKASRTIINEIYQSYEVENGPKFVLGEDVLRQLIASNFTNHKQGSFGAIPLVVNILVDEKGKATFKGIQISSNDTELDKEARRVAEIICQYGFIPASHRGETVKTIYPLIFLRSDITPYCYTGETFTHHL